MDENSVATSKLQFSGTKRVKSSAYLITSLFGDLVFKSRAKMTNSVGPIAYLNLVQTIC